MRGYKSQARVFLAAAVVLAACGGGDAERIAELEEQIADLQDQLSRTTGPSTTQTVEDNITIPTTPETLDTRPVTTISDVSTTSTSLAPTDDAVVEEGDVVTVEGTGPYLGELGKELLDQIVVVVSINGGLVSMLDSDAHQVFLLTAYDGQYDGGETRLRDPSEVFFINVEPDTDDPWSITFRPILESDKAELPVVSGEGDDVVWLVGAPPGVSIVTVDASCTSRESISLEIIAAGGSIVGSGFYSSDDELPADELVADGAEILAIKAEGCSWTLTWP